MKECVSVYYAVEEVLFQVATLPQVPHHTPCKKNTTKTNNNNMTSSFVFWGTGVVDAVFHVKTEGQNIHPEYI